MKSLKNKIFAGAFALASLGFFGAGNKTKAQDTDSLLRNSIKINFECWEGKTNYDKKFFPCFNDYKIPKNIKAKLNKENCEIGIEYNFYHVEKRGKSGKFECEGNLLKIALSNKHIKGRVDEFFHICYKTGIIQYIRIAHKGKELVPMIHQEALTNQDIYEKFGEEFANRTKEIINAQADSLKLTNLLKKEYEMGKLINENGEIEKVVYRFY